MVKAKIFTEPDGGVKNAVAGQRPLLLRVDMATGHCCFEPVSARWPGTGGRGLASSIVAAEANPACDPLGPRNVLALAPGLLGGSDGSNRLAVVCKSPLHNGLAVAGAGGPAGGLLLRLGIWALIFEGAAPQGRWRQLEIRESDDSSVSLPRVQLLPAVTAGLGTYATTSALLGKPGPNGDSRETPVGTPEGMPGERAGDTAEGGSDKKLLRACLCIGPAGERRLPVAGIACSGREGLPTRHASRGGVGAVMGAKGLKAIVLESRAVTPATPEGQMRGSGPEAASGAVVGCPEDCPHHCEAVLRDAGGMPVARQARRGVPAGLRLAVGGDAAGLAHCLRLCDDSGLDVFAVGRALERAVHTGLLRPGNAAGAARLLVEADADFWDAGLREEILPADDDFSSRRIADAIMDSVGLCRIAADAALRDPEARAAMTRKLRAIPGFVLENDDLAYLGRKILEIERTFSRHASNRDTSTEKGASPYAF